MPVSIEAAGGPVSQQQSTRITAGRNRQASATAAVGQFPTVFVHSVSQIINTGRQNHKVLSDGVGMRLSVV